MSYYKTDGIDPSEVIVDLSPHINALMAYDDISDLLTEEQEKKICSYVQAMGRMSHDKVSQRYPQWQRADEAHDIYVPPEATKFREKAVIADTRAIADTVLTYLMSALAGRNPMFQLEGLDRKSRESSAILERLMHQHMRRTAGEAGIAQHLLDSIRYGYAPTKVIWNPNTNTNDIINYNPRRTFHDPRVNWGDWDKMQFVIFVDYQSTNQLLSTNQYPKLQKYPALRKSTIGTKSGWEIHQDHHQSAQGMTVRPNDVQGENGYSLSGARTTDEVWVRLNGFEVGLPNMNQLWMVMTIIDESVVIRCQLSPYGQQFPAVFGGLHNDKHKTYSQSLYDLMLPLHDIGSWLLRSRIDNVQATLNNLIFADPTQVNISDLIDRNPWGLVRTLPGVKPSDGIHIASVPDVTSSHWNDMAGISEMKQRLSAASDAQQGLPTSDGIRSATEIQRLTQLGSQRLGVLARVMSATSIRPMARMMIGNLQDALELNGSLRVDSTDQSTLISQRVKDGYIDYTSKDIQGDIDYLVVDGTLPVEPTRSPETWMNMIQVMTNTGLNMEYKMPKIAEEAIRSMGISDLEQFKISEDERNQGPTPSQQMALLEKARGASVQPEEEVMSEVKKGNLIPMSEARR